MKVLARRSNGRIKEVMFEKNEQPVLDYYEEQLDKGLTIAEAVQLCEIMFGPLGATLKEWLET
jgi:hypothetical protein